ncbi:hypothetical protein CANMA_000751 [Candida margitis]|uniref:uncharacterized protein n=1 Tax=Candida margitis TaxID=1775924 RepID=UPI002225DE98|nr:uncharacterized protein CANMA_000751 [Candida margitis]KAI5970140.1 hypothetical protein CANMA_000751 [Candida margitis]
MFLVTVTISFILSIDSSLANKKEFSIRELKSDDSDCNDCTQGRLILESQCGLTPDIFHHAGLPQNEQDLRRVYCDLADSYSSILSGHTEEEHESWPTNGLFGVSITSGHEQRTNGHYYTSIGLVATNSEGATILSKGIVVETASNTRSLIGGAKASGAITYSSLLLGLVFTLVGLVT